MNEKSILDCHEFVEEVALDLLENPGKVELYNRDSDWINHFANIFESALKKEYKDYRQASAFNGDYKGLINHAERSVEHLKTKITELGELVKRQELLAICETLHPRLISFGVNPANFVTLKKEEQQQKELDKPVAQGMIQCFYLERDRLETADKWIRKLHELLQDTYQYIDKCEYGTFKNLFSFKRDEVREGETVNWINTVVAFAYFIQQLEVKKFINKNGYYVRATSCFTLNGKRSTSNAIRSSGVKAAQDVRDVVKEIMAELVRAAAK